MICDDGERVVDGITIQAARYFRCIPSIDDMPRCYLATNGALSAHGDSIRDTVRDLMDKAVASRDVQEIVASVKKHGTMTPAEYRALTGACRSGLREGMRSLGIDPDAESVPLRDVLRMCKGKYGGDRIANLFS